jgi:hypothetical protein
MTRLVHRRGGARLRLLVSLVLGTAFARPPAAAAGPTGASLTGTTGIFNIPTAEVTPEGWFRVGVQRIDSEWAYVERGAGDNETYFFTVGFLPRVEVSIRATIFSETGFLTEGTSDAADRLASGRVRVFDEGRWPALAVGVDDIRGNQRSHALYAVVTKTLEAPAQSLDIRATAGFASTAIEATAYFLDGAFGGVECSLWDRVTLGLEYDTEKWNTGARVVILSGLAAQGVLLHFDTPSGGVSWTHGF